MNDRNITKARFIQVNQLPQIDSHLTAKLYVDNSTDEPSVVRNFQDNDFNNYNLTNIDSITLNTQAVNENQVITEAYADQFHQENEQSRRDLGIDFFDKSSDLVEKSKDKDFNDIKLTNIDSNTVVGNPTLENNLANNIYVDDLIEDGTLLRFNQTLENYLKISVENDTYNLSRPDKIQVTDLTEKRAAFLGSDLLQIWKIMNIRKNFEGEIGNVLKPTKRNPQQARVE